MLQLNYGTLEYIKGDLDRNNVVDANDASVALELYKAQNATAQDIQIGDMDNNGLIDAIKFKYKDMFLFVFALEDNLVLTKSKYDLLDETTNDFFEEEATLEIANNI